MKTNLSLRRVLYVLLFLFANKLEAQNPSLKVFEDWNDTVGTQNMFRKNVVRPELGTTNVYVAGATLNSAGNYDLLVTKYNTSGAVIWTQQYDGNGNGDDYVFDLQLDNSGNVYVTGTTYENATDSLNAITIMYDASGNQQWLSTYNGNGSGNDVGAALYVDNSTGEVFVAGSEWEGSSALYDFLVLKYDNSGNQQWAANFDNTNLNDGAIRVTVNPSTGNVEAGGGTQTSSTSSKYLIVEFDNSSGSIQNYYTTAATTFGIDNLTDLKVDALGNVYVTGAVLNTTTGFDIRTIKLDTALNVVWSSTYAGSLDDMGNALVVDANNNVIVTGYTNTATQGRNYVTIKYNSAGTQQWAATFNGSANANDSATAIAVRDTNKIYVTGYSYNGSSKDYYTIRYDAAGNEIWGIGFNNINNGDDRAFEIVNDTTGQIYVTGLTKVNDSTYAYSTVKYVEKSTMLHDDTISYPSSTYVYIENRGQLIGNDTNAHPEVKYYAFENYPYLYFTDTSVIYALAKFDTTSAGNDSLLRVDMKFENGNADQKIRPLELRDDYCNFFYDHAERSRVQNYDQLISFNVWNNVDIVYGSNSAGFKYYFICKPGGGGGSASQIDLQYEGADSVRINGAGQLVIYTAFGNIIQPKAQAWQLDASGNYSSLAWQPDYTMLGTDEVCFTNFGSYNSAYPLIIAIDWGNGTSPSISTDNLLYSGWYGVGEGEIYRDIKVGHDGMVHTCGQTSSSSFPTTLNVIQSVYGMGSRDAIVVQYDPNGSRNWATYYGGTGWDIANGIDLDDTGAVYFVGETTTTAGSLLHPFWKVWGQFGYVDTTLNTGSTTVKDGFIVRLSSDGQSRQWATYLGGYGTDLAYSVAISENTGDIWVVGAGDTTGFPLVPSNTWSSTYGGGMIWRFWSLGGVTYSCFIGPTSNICSIHAIVIDSVGDAIIGGMTANYFPITPGCPQSLYGGGARDGFVAKLNGSKDNSLEWATFHGGEASDAVMGLDISPYGSTAKYFASGYTFSASLPFTAAGGGAYIDSTLNGQEDAFIAEFDTSGARTWATYYGGSGDEESFDVTTDNYGNIYFVAWTASNNDTMACPNGVTYCDNTYNGAADAVLVMFSEGSRVLNWSTYFGGAAGDAPYAVDCEDTSLYIVGEANSFQNTAYPFRYGYVVSSMGNPYHNNDNPGSGSKAFLAQFGLNVLVTGIDETTEISANGLNIYPNPASDNIFITGNVNAEENLTIEIIDILGQVVYSENLKPARSINKSIDVSNLVNGMYVVRVISDEILHTNKFLIQQ